MSTTRLTFLYPSLFRSSAVRIRDSTTRVVANSTQCSLPAQVPRHVAAPFSTSRSNLQAAFKRHGKAVEPLPAPPDATKISEADIDNVQVGDKDTQKAPVENDAAPSQAAADRSSGSGPSTASSSQSSSTSSATGKTAQQVATDARMKESGPMEAVLHMPPPQSLSHPYITASPYVHHFDTYTLVKQLEAGGYSKDQAITVMKAVRRYLDQNLHVAQGGLISKSDVDNETYLFNAACSELSTEVKNNRRAADEQIRQQRTHLLHEVDILGQRMTHDILTLKDDVRAAFHDRKMSVREEQRAMESLIQGINNKISVQLNGEAKSDIEGLRWVLIRRSVSGLLIMAIMTLVTLRYGAYVHHETQKAAEETKKRAQELKRNGGRGDHAPPVDAAQILAAN